MLTTDAPGPVFNNPLLLDNNSPKRHMQVECNDGNDFKDDAIAGGMNAMQVGCAQAYRYLDVKPTLDCISFCGISGELIWWCCVVLCWELG